jgi:CBS domain-containing protein
MKKSVEFLRPEDTVQTAAQRMEYANVGFLPICDIGGRVLGTITDRDIAVRVATQDRRPSEVRVDSMMSKELVTCLPNEDVKQAEVRMGKNRKSRIIVTDELGNLKGVISLSDIAEADPTNAGRTMRSVTARERKVA